MVWDALSSPIYGHRRRVHAAVAYTRAEHRRLEIKYTRRARRLKRDFPSRRRSPFRLHVYNGGARARPSTVATTSGIEGSRTQRVDGG